MYTLNSGAQTNSLLLALESNSQINNQEYEEYSYYSSLLEV